MHDEEAGGLITIAEYGQQYGREDPIKVLYYGFGHYDALEIPANRGPKTRLENFGARDSNGKFNIISFCSFHVDTLLKY